MQIKLSDTSSTTLDVSSVSQVFASEFNESSINITIRKPSQDFEYYKNLFVDTAVKTIVVLDSDQRTLATLNGDTVRQVALNIQDDETSIVIQVSCN